MSKMPGVLTRERDAVSDNRAAPVETFKALVGSKGTGEYVREKQEKQRRVASRRRRSKNRSL